jgi:hypothetical protein
VFLFFTADYAKNKKEIIVKTKFENIKAFW